MRNLTESANTITLAIAAAERASSLALQEAGRLLTIMPIAHLESDVAIECDQDSMEQLSQSIAAQIAARGAYVVMHRRQAALARKLGITVTAEGQCPPRPTAEIEEHAPSAPLRHLVAVA